MSSQLDKLTADEFKVLRDTFSKYDVDGNGVIK
jgi:Ca2+-binding EF-hand superfamily protein